jgi:hypothetical protein
MINNILVLTQFKYFQINNLILVIYVTLLTYITIVLTELKGGYYES